MSAVSLHLHTSSLLFPACSTPTKSLFSFLNLNTTNTTNLKSYTSYTKQQLQPCYKSYNPFPIYKTSQTCLRKHAICWAAAEYKFPDPIPEFADAETEKFKAHLLKRLAKKDIYGDELDEVVSICTEILSKFLHTEYGGPGTLLVLPFADMADAVTDSGLTGGPQAARAAVKWAQVHIDKDWKEWNNSNKSTEDK